MAQNSVAIRKVTSSDVHAALELIEEYYQAIHVVVRDSQESLLESLDKGTYEIWTAHIDGAPAGCVMLRPLPSIEKAGEVKRLYVRSQFRGKGIAQALMAALEKAAREADLEWLYLDTKDDLLEAIRFYEVQGYVRCERYNENPQATIFMRKSLALEAVQIRAFQPGDELAFRILNEAWISTYFVLEAKDRELLENPVGTILQKGGEILFAIRAGRAVGCCALMPLKNGSYEVSKMAVDEAERGQGIGRKLLQAIVDLARSKGIRRLSLETNSRLAPALRLYAALGFRQVEPDEPSPYARADVFMELVL